MKRRIIVYGLTILIIIGGWVALHVLNTRADKQIASTVLPPRAKEKIVIDQPHHTITTITSKGTKKQYLNPNGPVSVIENTNGTTTVSQRSWGTMVRPVAVAGLSSDFRMRVGGGLDLFYIQRFEAGAGLYTDPLSVKDVRAFVQVGYNVYSDVLIGLSLDNHHDVALLASLKF